MSESTLSTKPVPQHEETRSKLCHVCGRSANDGLIPFPELREDLKTIVAANGPAMEQLAHICPHCVALFSRAQSQLETHAAIFAQTSYVLPTPLRMEADERFTGRGVTVAFLDSGFYAHPDLTMPTNRILTYHSIFAEEGDQTSLETNDVTSWHGMMTSVVAAGNGGLADGFYRGIASEANLALVKIGRTGRITEDQIQRGLEWVLAHHKEQHIRVVNIFAGGDF